MEQPSYSSRQREEPESSLREWALKAQISGENTRSSRRFSGSHIRSFREDHARSFRSNITISSTASSPGYYIKEEIDPSTYSFTTALKALQARAAYVNSWECLSPEGFALNSKWNDAEKYICNPLSGEVPLECLSAKTLGGRSFRHLITNRITMSAPIIYSNPIPRHIYPNPSLVPIRDRDVDNTKLPVKETKMEGMTKDVGTQSTPLHDHSSSSPSPTTSTPSIVDRSLKRCEEDYEDSPNGSDTELKGEVKDEEKETRRNEEKESTEKDYHKEAEETKDKKQIRSWCNNISRKKQSSNGCLSWMRKRKREKHMKNTCLVSLKGR